MHRLIALAVWLGTATSLAAQGSSQPTTPRIQPLPEAQWTDDIRTVFKRFGQGGPASNDFKTLAHHPELLKGIMPFAAYIAGESGLAPRHRELLALRTAWLCRAAYVWAQHAVIAQGVGLSPRELRRVAEGPDAKGWEPFESTLLRAADELHVNSFVTDDTWKALAARYDPPRLLDVIFTAAEYTMLAGAMNSFGVQPDQGLTERLPSDVPSLPAAAWVSVQRIRPRPVRIPPLNASELRPEAQAVLDPSRSGRLVGTAAVYGHSLKAYQPRSILVDYIRLNSRLATSAPIAHETLILRTSLHNRSEIEWGAHQRFGREKGMSEEHIRGILAGPEAPRWDDVEAALLRAADEMQRDLTIGAATWNTLSRRFDPQQLMDIVFTIGGYRFLAMAQNAVGLPTNQPPAIPPVWLEPGARGRPVR
jgi:alkylhydroperoxidase family enzyme